MRLETVLLRLRTVMILCCLLGAGAAAHAESELVTDRPDQTESAVTVAPGVFQLELGWTQTRDDEDGVSVESWEAPGTLLRIGLAERVELRLGWTGFVDQEVEIGRREASVDGLGDAEIGAKILLAEERGGRPQMAVLVGTSVPVGDDAFTSDRFDPALRLALSHTLSERLSLGYNLGVGLESEELDGERHTLSTYLYTVALGIGLSERWGAFVELYGDLPGSAEGDDAHAFDGGLTYLLHDRLQLDLAAGVGLSDAAADHFIGLGLSVRWPR